MESSNTSSVMSRTRSPEVDTERLCPECGASMVEFDRLTEDGAVFIWYSCTREECTGQWLSKKVSRMRSV
jgi:rubredoxin